MIVGISALVVLLRRIRRRHVGEGESDRRLRELVEERLDDE